ncbi:MAG: hypothetical protein AB7N65_21585 [Vicinamibacterales bacterium]
MGGTGSGRWGWHSKKTTVEACLILAAGRLARDRVITRSSGTGWLSWTNTATGERTASAGYSREMHEDQVILWLRYTTTRRNGKKHDIEERVELQTTPSAVGGVRWWFTCPLVVNGRSCERRVGKLYLPPGSRYFGCRHCHDLTYTSCQESHQYDRLFGELAEATGVDPRLVKAMFARR